MRELFSVLDEWLSEQSQVALATVVSTWGSTPRPAGSHMLVNAKGEFVGSVSGGCVEGAVVEAASSVLRESRPQLLEFGVADEIAWSVGLACGGSIRVYVEPFRADSVYEALREDARQGSLAILCTVISGPYVGERLLLRGEESVGGLGPLEREAVQQAASAVEPLLVPVGDSQVFIQPYAPPLRMIVIGAVHTAIPLVDLAHTLDYRVTVVDARGAFATPERFPTADDLLIMWPDDALAQLKPDRSTAVIVLTHDPKFDEPALAAALRSDAGYIGAIGSRSTSADRAVRLRALGFSRDDIERIHSPIGLDLGAASPPETALSIVAEVVAERYGRRGGSLKRSVQEATAS